MTVPVIFHDTLFCNPCDGAMLFTKFGSEYYIDIDISWPPDCIGVNRYELISVIQKSMPGWKVVCVLGKSGKAFIT